MKNRFSKKVFLSLLMVLVLGVFLSGCGATTTIIAPPTATTCTIRVTSQSNLVLGQAVYMDGVQQPSTILVPWGSVDILNVTVGVRHTISIIQGNTFSHSEFITPVSGINYVDFYWF
jgi:hypothetical protein